MANADCSYGPRSIRHEEEKCWDGKGRRSVRRQNEECGDFTIPRPPVPVALVGSIFSFPHQNMAEIRFVRTENASFCPCPQYPSSVCHDENVAALLEQVWPIALSTFNS